MNPFFNMMNNPMMQIINQVQQIRQNPNQLANLLQQKGMITPQQAQDIQSMGGDYEQIGQYLMKQGRLPGNVNQYQSQVEQIQNMMKN
jgi:pentose-5-phosphate-3-epimerase